MRKFINSYNLKKLVLYRSRGHHTISKTVTNMQIPFQNKYYKFLPRVTFGGWHEETVRGVRRLVSALASQTGGDEGECIRLAFLMGYE